MQFWGSYNNKKLASIFLFVMRFNFKVKRAEKMRRSPNVLRYCTCHQFSHSVPLEIFFKGAGTHKMLPTYAIDNKIIERLNWSFESCIPFIELAVTSSLKTSVTDIFGEFIFYLISAEATPQRLLLHFSCINLTITCMSHALCFDLCWFKDDVSTFCGWKRKRKERKIFILNANVLVFLFLIHSLCFIIYLCMKICFLMCLLFHVHTLCSYRWMMMYICLEDLIKANSCECITLSNIFYIFFKTIIWRD